MGADNLTLPKWNTPPPISGRSRRGGPRGFGLTSQDAEAGPRNQMRLKVEGVVDRTVAGEKTLGRALGFESLLLSFSSSDHEVGVLRPIVLPHPTGLMTLLNLQYFQHRSIRRQLIRDDDLGADPGVAQQPPKQLQRRMLVSSLLDQDVQNLTLVIDGAPQIHPPPADPNDHFVQMPATRWLRATSAKVRRNQRPELDHPTPDRLPADDDVALRHQFFDVPDTEREAEIQPDRLTNHSPRKAVPLERYRIHLVPLPNCLTGDVVALDCQHLGDQIRNANQIETPNS